MALDELIGFVIAIFVVTLAVLGTIGVIVMGFLFPFLLPVVLLLSPVFAFLFIHLNKLWELTN